MKKLTVEIAMKQTLNSLDEIIPLLQTCDILQVIRIKLSSGLFGTQIIFDTDNKATYTILTENESLDFNTYSYAKETNLHLLQLHLTDILLIKRVN